MSDFDFIIVGSGPAGGLLASRLANAPSKPSVLLLEAGGPQPSQEELALSSRWTAFMTHNHSNWGYKTTPQPGLNGRILDISRGKAVGGTSNINFCSWTPPDKAFIDEWQARIGDDPLFGWEESQRLLEGIVTYNVRQLANDVSNPLHGATGRQVSEVVATTHSNKGGPFGVEYSADVKKGDLHILEGLAGYGFPMNRNLTSGNSLGFGLMAAMSTGGTTRTTAATAFLNAAPPNLVIKTGLEVSRVLFEGKTANAVEVNGGEHTFTARRCVVLSAGSINTPKVLMLSGIGLAGHLKDHGIPIIADMPGVGQHLKDHWLMSLFWQMDEEFAGAPVPASVVPSPNQDLLNAVVGFLHDETMTTQAAFSNLPREEQRFLRRKGTATVEIVSGANFPPGPPHPNPNLQVSVSHVTPQSTGSITLASADWRDAPIIDPNFLGDEGGIDLSIAVSYARKIMDFVDKTSSISNHIVAPMAYPKSDAEEDVIAFVREAAGPLWHPACTTRMGPTGDVDDDTVVDTSFRVRGVENLRVVDLSILPVQPTFHPTSIALLVGAWAAERMIYEYGL